MFIRMLLALVLLVYGGTSAHAATGDDIAGTVMAVQGQVTVTSTGQSGGPAAVAMPLHSKDTITTAPDARAIIVFTDESVLAVGGGAQIVIDDYRFVPENIHGNLVRLRAVRGALQYETGLLARLARPDILITIPQGKIMPRESRLWTGPEDGDSSTDNAPYHVYSAEGRVNIQTRRGSVLLDKGEAVLLTDQRSAPARAVWADDAVDAALMRVTLKDQEAAEKRIADERIRLREARGQSAIETAIIAHENAEKMQDNFPLPPASGNTNIAPAADTTPDVGLGQERGGAARTALD